MRGSRRRCCAGGVGRVETDRSRIAAGDGFARVAEFIIDFDELHLGELLEVCHEWTRNRVERAV